MLLSAVEQRVSSAKSSFRLAVARTKFDRDRGLVKEL